VCGARFRHQQKTKGQASRRGPFVLQTPALAQHLGLYMTDTRNALRSARNSVDVQLGLTRLPEQLSGSGYLD
jgi:hypothetical protein